MGVPAEGRRPEHDLLPRRLRITPEESFPAAVPPFFIKIQVRPAYPHGLHLLFRKAHGRAEGLHRRFSADRDKIRIAEYISAVSLRNIVLRVIAEFFITAACMPELYNLRSRLLPAGRGRKKIIADHDRPRLGIKLHKSHGMQQRPDLSAPAVVQVVFRDAERAVLPHRTDKQLHGRRPAVVVGVGKYDQLRADLPPAVQSIAKRQYKVLHCLLE